MQIKTINDYYDILHEKYPEVPIHDLKYILNYGWKSLYLHNSYGGDVVIDNSKLWCYFGTLYYNSILFFKYYINKLKIKLRVLFRKRNIPWDGYYYFALTDRLYENYLSQIHTRGRKRKFFNYGNHYLYLLKDECYLVENNREYIFRVPYYISNGFRLYKENFITDKAEFVERKPKRKFKDILIYNKQYDILNGTARSN